MRTTIYDIAKYSGVSTATVSKVLNNKGRISPLTKERVLDAVDKLNYHPSIAASSLKRKRTYTLGLVLPDITNPFFGEVAQVIENESSRRGYSVLITSTNNNPEQELTQIARMLRSELDGYIIASSVQGDSGIQSLIRQGSAVVLLDRKMPTPSQQVAWIATDHIKGGQLAGKHLIEQGHSDFRIFIEPLHLATSTERLQGFCMALNECGYEIGPGQIYVGGYGIDAGKMLARQLIDGGTPLPTAVFAGSDLIAIGAIQEFYAAGIRVPDDISIIGYDNITFSNHIYPRLTTIAQPIREMGEKAVELVLQRFMATERGAEEAAGHLLDPALVVRDSVTRISP